eukprot:4892242-Amphidinium_carterae.1
MVHYKKVANCPVLSPANGYADSLHEKTNGVLTDVQRKQFRPPIPFKTKSSKSIGIQRHI